MKLYSENDKIKYSVINPVVNYSMINPVDNPVKSKVINGKTYTKG